MMSPQQMQGLGSNYPMGNPAQQNQTYCMGMGNAAPPFMSNAAPPFLASAIRGMQPLPLSWVIITRAMQPQGMVTQAMQPTGL